MRVCLISSVHPWVNPRLIKEADLLASLGHEVTLVTKRVDAWADDRDQSLVAGREWASDRVNLLRHDPSGRRRWFTAAVRAKAALAAYRVVGGLRLSEEGYYRGFQDVLRAALRTRAEFFIAHTQGALPLAARAAARTGARYGFDCEDLLAEEAADGLTDPAVRRAILDIERAWIPAAGYVTATSDAMAAHLACEYSVRPRVVRNVFPLAELTGVEPPARRGRRETTELVWMSATIGDGRGLEDGLRALALLPASVRLTLFGRVLPSYAARLSDLIDTLGIGARVTIRPVVPPAHLMARLAEFDVGLTLDPNECLNRSLTICNKVFLYLQAGLLVAASDTPGQREVAEAVPRGAVIYPPGDARALAATLGAVIADRAKILDAQTAAWNAGQDRYNWDREREVFLAAFHEAAGLAPVAPRRLVAV
jgi:glycosyltransferase involved in cell wall biosynthesis